MSYAGRTKVTIGQLANADATFLAASATVNRYIRQLHACNTTAGAVQWNFGIGATLTAAVAQAFGKTIAANSIDQIFFSPGLLVVNTIMRAFSNTATAVTLTATYDEEAV